MAEQAEWQYCRCEEINAADSLCGCGNIHAAEAGRPEIHWRERHWHWRCAFQSLLEENDEMRQRLVKMAVDKVFQRRRNLLQDFTRPEDK